MNALGDPPVPAEPATDLRGAPGPLLTRFSHVQSVYLVGGGPSLVDVDWGWLNGKATIAVNNAYQRLPNARVLWWTDYRWWEIHREAVLAHAAPALCAARDPYRRPYPWRVTCWAMTGLRGVDLNPGCLRHGNQGGYAALNLAVQLGARRVVLVGYDLCHDEKGADHWHTPHPWGVVQDRTLREKMLPSWDGLRQVLHDLGIEVVNANPRSALREFPFTDEVPHV